MNCREAREYFDAYLDGELSSTLSTELGAHRLRCADCRRRLALLEVTGHIIASDRDPVALDDAFTDRLLACMDEPRTQPRWRMIRRYITIAGPIAAAAVVVFALMGGFAPRAGNKVASEIVTADRAASDLDNEALFEELAAPPSTTDAPPDGRAKEVNRFLEQVNNRVTAKRQAGEYVQKIIDLSIIQLLNIVNPTGGVEVVEETPSESLLSAPANVYEGAENDAEPIEDL